MSSYTNSIIALVKRLKKLDQIVLVLDASFVIAMCEQMEYPEFIDKLLALNYKLVIPSTVWKEELKCNPAHDIILKYCKEHKIEIIDIDAMNNMDKSLKHQRDIQVGEIYVFSAYSILKNNGIKVCCVFDDKRARAVAKKKRIEYTGAVGLLLELKREKLLSPQKVNKIGISLDKNGFRLSRSLKALLAAN